MESWFRFWFFCLLGAPLALLGWWSLIIYIPVVLIFLARIS